MELASIMLTEPHSNAQRSSGAAAAAAAIAAQRSPAASRAPVSPVLQYELSLTTGSKRSNGALVALAKALSNNLLPAMTDEQQKVWGEGMVAMGWCDEHRCAGRAFYAWVPTVAPKQRVRTPHISSFSLSETGPGPGFCLRLLPDHVHIMIPSAQLCALRDRVDKVHRGYREYLTTTHKCVMCVSKNADGTRRGGRIAHHICLLCNVFLHPGDCWNTFHARTSTRKKPTSLQSPLKHEKLKRLTVARKHRASSSGYADMHVFARLLLALLQHVHVDVVRSQRCSRGL